MDFEALSGRRLWLGLDGPELDAATVEHLLEVRPGGIVLFRRNMPSVDATRDLVQGLRELLGERLHIAVDQEGGLVVRFLEGRTIFPGNMALGALAFREPSMGEDLSFESARKMARELADLGIDVNLAPVLDLAVAGGNPGIGIRSFGAYPELGEKLGSAFVRGSLEGGVSPCAKHFPGKGQAMLDAHFDLPTVAHFDRSDALRPFRAAIAAGVPLVMTSHVVYADVDAQNPATFSSEIVTGILRQELGFEGLIMTDDLLMGAMVGRYGFEEIVTRATAAGHDVLCICADRGRQREAFRLLSDMTRRGDQRAGDLGKIAARLDRLPAAGPPPPAVDLGRGELLAEAIAGRAITLLEEGPSRLPIALSEEIALISPTSAPGSPVEDPLRGESDGSELAELLGAKCHRIELSTDPTEEEIAAALYEAQRYPVLLVATTAARFRAGQARLLRLALETHPRAIAVPLRNPFDLEAVPHRIGVHAVIPYGYRSAQLRALVRVLRGDVQSYGRLPVALVREP